MMSYPGDPAGGQQPAYPYSDGQGAYQQPPNQSPFGAPQPQSGPPAAQPYAQPAFGADPAGAGQPYGQPAFGADPGPAYGGYGYDPNAPGAAPTSGGYGPNMAPPISGPGLPPVSGPGVPPTTTGRRSPAMAIFASLMVVFLLATAILTVLYVTKNGDYNDQKKVSAQRQDNINALQSDLDKTKADLQKAADDLAATKRDLGGAQGQADELKRQKSVISRCINLLVEASQAAAAGNAGLANAKEAEAQPVCAEADKYLD
jgi:hypothetical protein